MSLFSDNVIPGEHGKTFETNAHNTHDLKAIQAALSAVDGIVDVLVDTESFPKSFTVHTNALVQVEVVEKVVNELGFHTTPKSLFKL